MRATVASWRARLAALCGWLLLAAPAMADEAPWTNERELKVAFVYNFMLFTQWPAEVGATLNLCVDGADSFGHAVDALQGKAVGARRIAVQHKARGESLQACQLVFIADQVELGLARVLDELSGMPVLTVADSPDAAHRGCGLSMNIANNKVAFEVNLQVVRAAGIKLSSKLLRLATEVIQ